MEMIGQIPQIAEFDLEVADKNQMVGAAGG